MSFQKSIFTVVKKEMKYSFGNIFKSILCLILLLLLQFSNLASSSSTTFETEWLSQVFPSTNQTQSTLSPSAKMSLVPGYVLELYDNMRFEDEDARHSQSVDPHNEAVRSFTVRLERVIVGPMNAVKRGLNFNLTYLPKDANILSVELVIPVKAGVRRARLLNTQVTFGGVSLQLMPQSSTNIDYLVYDATQALLASRLDNNPWVEVSSAHLRQNSTRYFENLLLDRALIVVYENLNASNLRRNSYRKKRHATQSFIRSFQYFNSSENTTQTNGGTSSGHAECGLHPWYVDFQSLRWFWVVYPPGYYANTCGGSCTAYMTRNRTSNYAVLKSLYHRQTSYRHADTLSIPSCTPTTMSSVYLIYINLNCDIISKRLPQMAVKECGCR